MSEQCHFWIGTYTRPAPHVPHASGRGVVSATLDILSGDIEVREANASCIDPTYLARQGNTLAAVSEQSEGELHLFEIGFDGSLRPVRHVKTGGTSPCHLAPVNDSWAIANYHGHRLQVLTGSELLSLERYCGSGPIHSRQEGPHPHQVLWLEKVNSLAVSDLGSDRIWLHSVGEQGISSHPTEQLHLSPGAGPRHMVWHPPSRQLFVLGELDGSIHAFAHAGGNWNPRFSCPLPALPATPSSAAIRLHPSGKMLYTSERSESRIDAFVVRADGFLVHESTFSSEGDTPRDFNIDPSGAWLIAANQDSNSLVCVPLDPTTGAITGDALAPVTCGTPVCICF